jgi:serine/threonine protein kinase
MGVVYKARQVSLDRLVALKMILAGPYASTESVQRFHMEARAAARLQHPHLVAIHEVGAHDGQHYFSMDYVPGQNLAQCIADCPFPIADSGQVVRWLKTIAEAVHYAHQQGIIHRDLKPSNILIDSAGQPRITDFGLAKRLSDPQLSTLNPQLTLTGQVLGSPNYVAPEQAAARQAEVGVASDVWSLGAILYHLLTGRPPFHAETPTETLHQVIHAEPVAPRALQRGVPCDLETICLKCLSKAPADRYPSAAALAEDLGRWLAGEPILARRLSGPERLRRWSRRHPVAATLSAAATLALLVASVREGRHQLDLWRWQRRPELYYVFVAPGEVYLTDPQQTAWQKLPGQINGLDVSPDLRRLCFLRQQGAGPNSVFIANLDGTGSRPLMDNVSGARWLNNDTILYEAIDARSVWSIQLPTGRRQQLFLWSDITPAGYAGSLSLSPDRTHFVCNPQSNVNAQTADIFVCDLQGRNARVVWEDKNDNTGDSTPL